MVATAQVAAVAVAVQPQGPGMAVTVARVDQQLMELGEAPEAIMLSELPPVLPQHLSVDQLTA
jgi:hypothetical protein